jgi:hypothetical protein
VTTVAHLGDDQRRARLVVRHGLGRRPSDPLRATRSVVALHASDPATPYLGLWARVAGTTTGDLDHELYGDRRLWRLHAMRRTLFVVPADEHSVFDAAATRAVAAAERRKLEGWLEPELGAGRTTGWLADVEDRVLAALDGGRELLTAELTAAVPELATPVTLGSGRWTTRSPVSSRLLFLLAMDGRLVRARPAGSWRSSQYRWADAASWFGPRAAPLDAADGRVELARRYLAAFGPVTLTDLRWWAGWTAAAARQALQRLGAATVTLDGGADGFVLPADLEPSPAPERRTVALLPGLDPTPMGYKQRAWFLGPHGAAVFDRNGNVGPTAWVDGRIVGGWAQRRDGRAVLRLLEVVDDEAAALLGAEVAALTGWLDGVVVTPRFRTPLERELAVS